MQGFNRPSKGKAVELLIALFKQKIRLLNNCQFSRNSKGIVLLNIKALVEMIKTYIINIIWKEEKMHKKSF